MEENLNYALHALNHPEERDTETFRQWITHPENKSLFIDLMAYKEAAMREQVARQQRRKHRISILRYVSAAAAVLLLALFIPSLLPESTSNAGQPVRFFTADSGENRIMMLAEGIEKQQIEGRMMDIRGWQPEKNDTVSYHTLVTPRGKDFMLILEDGTKVWLNAGSILKFPLNFSGTDRRVSLKGEAYFEVTSNKEHPFIVDADGIDVRVLGTKFNVHAYAGEEKHVTLVEGKVEISEESGKTPATVLRPGQNFSYNEEGSIKISDVNTNTFTAWTEGMFYFEDMPLGEIMSSLGRWYNVNIDFERKELSEIRLNFWASRKNGVSEAVELLNKLGKIRADYHEGTVTIAQIH